MKNMYKAHCNLFIRATKGGRLSLQREAGYYYITDGPTLLKVPAPMYDEYIRPLSPLFIPLKDGERATKQRTGNFMELDQSGFDAKHIYDTTNAETPVQILPVKLCHDGKDLQLVTDEKHVWAYNAAYIAAIKDYIGAAKVFAGAGKYPAIKSEIAVNLF